MNEDVVTERKKSVHEEIADAEGGEYENEPVRNPDGTRLSATLYLLKLF
jgi:hypothetical protein